MEEKRDEEKHNKEDEPENKEDDSPIRSDPKLEKVIIERMEYNNGITINAEEEDLDAKQRE